jgi:hypothetical protein
MQFKARSFRRDEKRDASRLASIERAILGAITDAEADRAGLQQRIESARVVAAFALSNGIDDYLQREPEDEKSLIKSEADMVSGQARVRQLDDHIEHFCRLLQLLRARMSEGLLKRAPPPTDLDDR